jgi:diaminopimelate decarboxylase
MSPSHRPRRVQHASRSAFARLDPTTYTPHYTYCRTAARDATSVEQLFCENVPLEKIARAAGTPAYVYSHSSIEDAYRGLDHAFRSLRHTLCYAVKANSNLSVLRVLASLGSSFDIVSGGELDRLRRVGVPGERIVFSGVGKTRDEIRAALRYRPSSSRATRTARSRHREGIFLFNIESAAELELFAAEAARHVRAGAAPPPAAVRLNPDVLAGGHRHISTGRREHKFGIDWSEARDLYLAHANSPWLHWRGISAHIGSQILTVAPYRRAAARLASGIRELARAGVRLDCVDIGGGLGIRYSDEKPLDLAAYAHALADIVRPLNCRLLLEPGRSIVGAAGVLLTRVLYVKGTRGKRFVVVDAAMNDMIRPVLYGATHPNTPTTRTRGNALGAKSLVDVVGPVCETGDFLARDWPMEDVRAGDLLALWGAGAYGFVESSNYNSRRRPAEVLVKGSRFQVVRRRESYADLVRGEVRVE